MDVIFERPALYLGHASVIKMQAFVDGYAFALFKEDGSGSDPIYDGFGRWVVEHGRTGQSGQYPWSSIATLIGVSEAESFEVAKRFWEKYKSEMEPSPTHGRK